MKDILALIGVIYLAATFCVVAFFTYFIWDQKRTANRLAQDIPSRR